MVENPAKPRRRFQFSLRTLFAVVTALCVLLAQWPLLEWVAAASHITMRHADGTETVQTFDIGWYIVPTRVIVVASIEAVLLIYWIIGVRRS